MEMSGATERSLFDDAVYDDAIYADIQAALTNKFVPPALLSKSKHKRIAKWKVVFGVLLAVQFFLIVATAAWCTTESIIAKQNAKATTQFLESINMTFETGVKSLAKLMDQTNQVKSDLRKLSLDNEARKLQLKEFKLKVDAINRSIIELVDASPEKLVGIHPSRPASSCRMISDSSPSGYYWVLSSYGSAISVFCDFNTSCGPANATTSGWMRVTSLDMKNNSSQCPSSLCLTRNNPRTCSRCSFTSRCAKQSYPVGAPYSRVCGRIIAYQVGDPDAYFPRQRVIDGINLSYGTNKLNIWTFYAASGESSKRTSRICPCINSSNSKIHPPPKSVGKNYFCDTAVAVPKRGVFYQDNPLWDGAGCGGDNTCCSFNKPPWFYRELPGIIMDDIEMKVCLNLAPEKEDLAVEKIDIYVQ